jgi:hypothetical protein
LSAAKALQTVHHHEPSTIGLDTIYRSKGNIPESFLRGAGVPEDFIVYMKSLVGKAIDFYSCFISYSSKEHEFAETLRRLAEQERALLVCAGRPQDRRQVPQPH